MAQVTDMVWNRFTLVGLFLHHKFAEANLIALN